MRVEDIAVPAGAHVVDHVGGEGEQFGLRRFGEGHARGGPLDAVGHDGDLQPLLAELAGDDVDFMSARDDFARELHGPLFQTATMRIELFEHQADSHYPIPNLRSVNCWRERISRIRRSSAGRVFGAPVWCLVKARFCVQAMRAS